MGLLFWRLLCLVLSVPLFVFAPSSFPWIHLRMLLCKSPPSPSSPHCVRPRAEFLSPRLLRRLSFLSSPLHPFLFLWIVCVYVLLRSFFSAFSTRSVISSRLCSLLRIEQSLFLSVSIPGVLLFQLRLSLSLASFRVRCQEQTPTPARSLPSKVP